MAYKGVAARIAETGSGRTIGIVAQPNPNAIGRANSDELLIIARPLSESECMR